MREQIIKMVEMLEAVLSKQGESQKSQLIYQSLLDFKNSTENEIKRDLSNNDHSDIDKLRKNISVYNFLIEILNEDRREEKELLTAHQEIYRIYDKYELKYLLELEYRNEVQRQNYIETILAPLMLITRHFESLAK